ncbi:MAG: YeiH family protein, partial [Burkholderiaceae bacterium]
ASRVSDMNVPYLSSAIAIWRPRSIQQNWPGVAVAIAIALSASFISMNYGGPQLLYALFFGLAFHFLSKDSTCQPGIEFCSKVLLRAGVALLGVRITLEQIVSVGIAPLVIVISALMTTIGFGYLLSKWLKRPIAEGLLSGGSVAICGASAAMAISAVLPQTKENEKFTLLTVVGVTGLSTMAMIVYPLLVKLIGLDPTEAGVFIGGTVHDVAQVVGAGYLVSNHTGDVATFVKLTRVACLVPVVLGLSIAFKAKNGKTELDTPPIVPFFLLGFIFLVIINSLGAIPHQVGGWISDASRACLVTAIAALGVKTSFQSLASLGWRPVIMLVMETVWIAALVIGALLLSR